MPGMLPVAASFFRVNLFLPSGIFLLFLLMASSGSASLGRVCFSLVGEYHAGGNVIYRDIYKGPKFHRPFNFANPYKHPYAYWFESTGIAPIPL